MSKPIILSLFFALIASAQQTAITGRVTDPSGAVIVSAKVAATGEDGSKFSTITTNEGRYQFPAVRAATYVLRFEAPGFAPAERDGYRPADSGTPPPVERSRGQTGVT